MTKNKIVLSVIGLTVAAFLLGAAGARSMQEAPTAHAEATSTPPLLTHQQLVWSYTLEWCESRGNVNAINPKDRDNTPSYYSFQWKPSTFKYFANMYGVVATSTSAASTTELMHDYPTEREVIEAMIHDGKHIDWHQQFPDCVKKFGTPPLSPSA